MKELSPKNVQETKKVNIETMDNPKLFNIGISFSKEYIL